MPQYVEVNGQNIEFPDGMAVGDIEAALKKNALSLPAAVSAGKAINSNINSIPRQIGLTARYGLEGVAQGAQVFTEPLRYLTDKFVPDRGGVSNLVTGQAAPPKSTPLSVQATKLADLIGLPSPETANEQVIGDATRLVAGAGGLGGGAQLGARLPGMVGTVMTGLAANPLQQLTSAAGAGLAGGASREAGGNAWTQGLASLAGGVVGGVAPGAFQTVMDAGRRLLSPALTPQQIDVQLSTVLGQAGTDFSRLPANVKASLRAQLKDSLQAGKELDPAAVSRLADFARVGATPTRGMVSQNPVQITREQNLAKMAANSADGELHGLPLMQNQNNATLIRNLNNAGGGTETLPIAAGRLVQDRIQGANRALGAVEQGAWNFAKGTPGYTAPISNAPLQAAFKAVDDEALLGFLPKQTTDYMGAFQSGAQPFTPQQYKNLRSMLSGSLAAGGNEAAAARAAIRGLESMPMKPLTNMGGVDFGGMPSSPQLAAAMRGTDAQAPASIAAVDRARAATAAKYRYQESSPLVRAALADARTADPEKIAQSFILNGTVNDARSVAQEVGPQGIETIRNTLATYIKKQALSGANDETGKVSQSALNAVLRKIGDEKLNLFFSPEEVAGLRATGRVASLIQSQPVGSAVNNSNSGALVLGKGLDLLSSASKFGPLGKSLIADPVRQWQLSIGTNRAQNVVPGLLAPVERPPLGPALLLPGLAVGGGLLSP